MTELLYNLCFLLITLYILLKAIFYGIYEINSEKNKSGGITIIIFSILIVIFANVMMFLK